MIGCGHSMAFMCHLQWLIGNIYACKVLLLLLISPPSPPLSSVISSQSSWDSRKCAILMPKSGKSNKGILSREQSPGRQGRKEGALIQLATLSRLTQLIIHPPRPWHPMKSHSDLLAKNQGLKKTNEKRERGGRGSEIKWREENGKEREG